MSGSSPVKCRRCEWIGPHNSLPKHECSDPFKKADFPSLLWGEKEWNEALSDTELVNRILDGIWFQTRRLPKWRRKDHN